MKPILVIALVLTAFAVGVYYENSRLVGEPDKTIAVFLSKQALENSRFQLKQNSEYLALIQSKSYEKLKELIESNDKLLSRIENEAASICERMDCTEKQQAYIKVTGSGL